MPAKLLRRVDEEGVYSHIFNRGLENKSIFKDNEDYKTFKDFLNEYLTSPKSFEDSKRVFTVKGQTFRGVPHLPKNYANDIELIAFGLTPNRFDLLLRQINKGSLEKFMRSLSTRYSIYFNKKYSRTGTVFEGPYKSSHIANNTELLNLTRQFHRTGVHSSFSDYADQNDTSWVKPKVVLDHFDREKNATTKGFSTYKDYVDKFEVDHKESKPIAVDLESVPTAPQLKSPRRIPEILAAGGLFLMLFSIGIKNITSANIKAAVSQNPSTTSVLSESTVSSPTPSPEITVIVKTASASSTINIRKSPNIQSEVIGKAADGQIFQSTSLISGWYEVKLEDGLTGYIISKYIEIYKNE